MAAVKKEAVNLINSHNFVKEKNNKVGPQRQNGLININNIYIFYYQPDVESSLKKIINFTS